jgi:hemoglobin/transferrin/lactoferrin receptor protein
MNRIYITMLSTIVSIQTIFAQQPPAADTAKSLEEVVISASNFNEKKKNVVQKIDIITSKSIANANAQNTGDLLASTGKIFVQKSQQGGSSPVLRGFEASRVLLVIDGVRMNNAIYRSGHLQNVITTDQNMLSRVEVMYGPASTIYGSDALGGVIHFITKSPVLSGNKNFLTTGSAFTRYSSVNNEKTIHADVSIGGKRVAWLQSYNFSDFGDMKMGDNYPSKFPNFGRRRKYIARINGIDSIVNNSDDRVQKFSGYKQWDITQKILFQQNEKISHLLNFQLSNSNDVPRYDRLQDTFTSGANRGLLRFAEWYYGPQKRVMGAYQFSAKKTAGFDEVKLNINYQDIEESRQQREYRRYDRFDSRIEKVKVWGTTLNGRKTFGNNELVVGLDAQFNDVKSVATRTNLTTGVIGKLDSRYPNGKNKFNNYGVYAQHTYKFANNKLVLNEGIRVQGVSLTSNVADNSAFSLPDTAVKQSYVAVTGNIGLVYTPHHNTVLRVGISSGFRAPNIDDLAKIFETSTSLRQVVVPNANVKAEYTYNIDLSLNQKISNAISFELTGYYTIFRNGLIKAPFKFNGQDSIIYNGNKSQVLATQNTNKAYVYGFSAGLDAIITKGLTLSSSLSYTYGRFKTDASKPSSIYEKQPNGTYALVQRNVSTRPLDHVPPVIGRTTIAYQHKKFGTEVFMQYNGWKKLDDFLSDGEDNPQYATAEGYPAWSIISWRGHVTITKNLLLQAGIDNITDRNYRPFASGFSGSGRNYIVSLRATW